MNCYLNQQFRSLLDRGLAGSVRPLSVISIDELEVLLPYVDQAKFSWSGLLSYRFDRDEVSLFSFLQAFYDIVKREAIPPLRNEFLEHLSEGLLRCQIFTQ